MRKSSLLATEKCLNYWNWTFQTEVMANRKYNYRPNQLLSKPHEILFSDLSKLLDPDNISEHH